MGLDEALLLTPSHTTLRLYRWDPPGLSLGYFQASAAFDPPPPGAALVRRITGGGAIYHAGDLTFSLTIDTVDLPKRVEDSYALVHGAIGRALIGLGAAIQVDDSGPPARASRPDEPWCLADGGPTDLRTADGLKVVGSAQRRLQQPVARVLHHGSIALESHATTPRCGSLQQALPDVAVSELETALVRELAHALQMQPVIEKPSDDELALAERLASEKYADPSFVQRR